MSFLSDNLNRIYALNPELSGKRLYWNGLSGDNNFIRCKNQQYHDPDFDMLSNYSEEIYHTSPNDPDTDNDLLLDGNEIAGVSGHVTNATNPDTDGDSLLDGEEIYTYSTNPTDVDTDNDGFNDGYEIRNNFDPNNLYKIA